MQTLTLNLRKTYGISIQPSFVLSLHDSCFPCGQTLTRFQVVYFEKWAPLLCPIIILGSLSHFALSFNLPLLKTKFFLNQVESFSSSPPCAVKSKVSQNPEVAHPMLTRAFHSASRSSWSGSSSHNPSPSGRSFTPPQEGTLEVQLLSGRDLPHTDIFTKSDPYALITYGRQTRKSHVARGQGSKPEWNQVFRFPIDPAATELSIAVYDEDYLMKDDLMGTVIISLSKVFSTGSCPPQPYPMVRPSKKFKGEVKVQLSYFPPEKLEPQLDIQRAYPQPSGRPSSQMQENDYIDFPGPYGRQSAGGWTMGI